MHTAALALTRMIVTTLPGILLILIVVLDAFQTIILPRRPTGRLRITRLFYIVTWTPWATLARRIHNPRRREQIYSVYGPLSLVLLLVVWAMLLITGFALIYLALGTPFKDEMMSPVKSLHTHFWTDLYVSGTTLFTLGLGDVVPLIPGARAVIVFESGVGLGLVALVVGYLPVLYTAFSRREVAVALLDARAGSPPTAGELLARHSFEGGELALIELLAEWERWAAELLESHVSYPILCYYRSQHDNQSWLSALVAILDACALLIATQPAPTQPASATSSPATSSPAASSPATASEPFSAPAQSPNAFSAEIIATAPSRAAHGIVSRQAQLTFAIARHAIIDLGHVFTLDKTIEAKTIDASTKSAPEAGRLTPADFRRLCTALAPTEIQLCGDLAAAARLRQLRDMYEPHAQALGDFLGLALPLWIAEPRARDPWYKIASLRSTGAPATTGDPIPAIQHVSELSTTADLHNRDHGH